MAAAPTLSYSSTRTYLECPLRWKFLYVDNLPEAPRGYFSFGKTLHAVLEELARPLLVPLPRTLPGGKTQTTLERFAGGAGASPAGSAPRPVMSRSALEELYGRLWKSEGYTSAEEEARYRSLGRELLFRFYEEFTAEPPVPVAIEEHLQAEWDGLPIHGYVDRIDLTPRGGLEVLDYKTSRGLSLADVQSSDQLSFYQVLVSRNFAAPVESLALYDLRSTLARRVPSRSEGELGALQVQVGEVADGIRAGRFDPTPGRHCQRCEFRDRCPEFRSVPEAERLRLGELVDRFVALRNEERTLDRELRRVAESLHREAERLALHRIEGATGTALRRREERLSLAPGAFNEIVGTAAGPAEGPLDSDRIAALLRDPALSPEARIRLRRAVGRTVRWFWELDADGEKDRRPRNR